jgi:hypothetical protein
LTEAQTQVSTVLAELAAVDQMLRTNFGIRLLAEPSVVDDLQLNSAQTTAAKALLSQMDAVGPQAQANGVAMTSSQIREMASNDAAVHEAALGKILSPVQLKRLGEISRQIRGVFAFSDADVAAALALTPVQKSAVRSACAGFLNRRHHGPPQFGDESERTEMDATVQQILTKLTARQTDIWNTLTGERYNGYAIPYEFWFSPMHRHGPGDGPDGPPPDGPDHGPGGPGPDGPRDGPGRHPDEPPRGPGPGPDGGFDPGRNGRPPPPGEPANV